MHIEASSPRVRGETAVLESRLFSPKDFFNTKGIGIGACVSFWYHMNGVDIGDLNVYVGHSGTAATVSGIIIYLCCFLRGVSPQTSRPLTF